jgi:hypothetical protein
VPSTWTYYLCDLQTDRVIGEFPMSSPTFGQKLNDIGDFSGTIQLGSDDIQVKDPLGSTTPAKTSVYVDQNGTLVWGGMVWERSYDKTNNTLEVKAKEFLSYYNRRKIRQTLAYTNTDQCSICRGIVSWAESQTGGSINMQYGTQLSGVGVSYTANSYDRLWVYEALGKIVALDGGPDHGVDAIWGPGPQPMKVYNVDWPQRGRGVAESQAVFTDQNVAPWSFDESASDMRTRSEAIGAGDGTATLIATATATDLIALGWPLLEDVDDHKDITDKALLDSLAAGDLATYSSVLGTWSLPVRTDIEPTLASYTVGDVIYLDVTGSGLLVPDQLVKAGRYAGYQRIIGTSVDPVSEVATLTLGPVTLT